MALMRSGGAVSSSPDGQPQGLPLPLTGRTSVYAILGDPIAQAGSPILFNTAFRQRGWTAAMVPFHVTAEAFPETLQGLRGVRNLRGLILTTPHKTAALSMVDSIGPEARLVRSINAIRCREDGKWLGENFDGLGCVRGLLSAGHVLTDRRILLVGTGGAGRALAAAVARENPKELCLYDIDTKALTQIATDLRNAFPELRLSTHDPDPNDFDILINCTPLGMAATPGLPVDCGRLRSGTLVVDLVIEPEMTPLLAAAKARGCLVQPGRRTLEGQVDAICGFFAGDDHD
jgi:shikimate dehydrogenase